MTKMTNKDFFNVVLNANLGADVNAWAEKQINALNAKAEKAKSTPRKPSKATLERKAIADSAFLAISAGTYSIEELQATGAFGDYSKGQVASIMADYVNDGKVQRTLDHKKVKYIFG